MLPFNKRKEERQRLRKKVNYLDAVIENQDSETSMNF
jgi:hypothetical protein